MNHPAKVVIVIASVVLLFTDAIGQKKVTTISCGTCGMNATYLPKPTYPAAAKAIGLNGKTVIKVLIDENGSVIAASVASGHGFFHRASLKAAYEAKFKPHLLSGKPVRVNSTIVYNFVKPSESSFTKSADQKGEAGRLVAESEIKTPKLPIINDRAINLAKPQYSQELKDLCTDGRVEIKVGLNEDGTVRDATALTGDELLYDAAIAAVKRSKFRTYHDLPVKSHGVVVYNFLSERLCINVGNIQGRWRKKPNFQVHPDAYITEAIEVTVRLGIDVAMGKVLAAKALGGHPLIRAMLEKEALLITFSPVNITSIVAKSFIKLRIHADRSIEIVK